MRGERWLLRAGEFLVARGARRLPAAAREERRREWEAELPVILGDPEVKAAAVRAARMLLFAADTLRGTVLRPGPRPARHQGAHSGASTLGKDARELGLAAALLVALLAGIGALLAFHAYMFYLIIFGVSPASYVGFYVWLVLANLAVLASRLRWGRPGGAYWYLYSAGVAAAATGRLASVLAGHLGWGQPLLFTLISDCGYAAGAACISVELAIMTSVWRPL